MFRTREPQESLWQSEFLITPRKARLMRRSWAQVFRKEALPLIDEERFAEMYSADMGRPNRAVQTVLGVLVLKEMFDLTDIEALEELEFNLLWHHALGLEMEEALRCVCLFVLNVWFLWRTQLTLITIRSMKLELPSNTSMLTK